RRALAPRLLAEALRTGAVSSCTAHASKPSSDNAAEWQDWARAAALGALVAAERGARAVSRAWLAELRDADLMVEAGGALQGPVASLCSILEGDGLGVIGSAPTLIG